MSITDGIHTGVAERQENWIHRGVTSLNKQQTIVAFLFADRFWCACLNKHYRYTYRIFSEISHTDCSDQSTSRSIGHNAADLRCTSLFISVGISWIRCVFRWDGIFSPLMHCRFHWYFIGTNHDQFISQWHHIMFFTSSSAFFSLSIEDMCNPSLLTHYLITVRRRRIPSPCLSLLGRYIWFFSPSLSPSLSLSRVVLPHRINYVRKKRWFHVALIDFLSFPLGFFFAM